jgi:hypothetical protein
MTLLFYINGEETTGQTVNIHFAQLVDVCNEAANQ